MTSPIRDGFTGVPNRVKPTGYPAANQAAVAMRVSGGRRERALAGCGPRFHPPGMVVVSEAEAAAIRTAFDRGGELLVRFRGSDDF
jgi:hypothetical protein